MASLIINLTITESLYLQGKQNYKSAIGNFSFLTPLLPPKLELQHRGPSVQLFRLGAHHDAADNEEPFVDIGLAVTGDHDRPRCGQAEQNENTDVDAPGTETAFLLDSHSTDCYKTEIQKINLKGGRTVQ
jgi:hypothetical protein